MLTLIFILQITKHSWHHGPQDSVLLPKQGLPTNTRLPPLVSSHTKSEELHPQSWYKRYAGASFLTPLCPRLVFINGTNKSDCSPQLFIIYVLSQPLEYLPINLYLFPESIRIGYCYSKYFLYKKCQAYYNSVEKVRIIYSSEKKQL